MSDLADRALLAVLAHPDDESFGPGGTLALYASRGVQVHLLCATRGEVGTVAPELMAGHATIGDLRQTELECAASHLGLAGVHFLGYRELGDARLPRQPPSPGSRRCPDRTGRGGGRRVDPAPPPAGGHHLRPDRRVSAPRSHRLPQRHRPRLRGGRRPGAVPRQPAGPPTGQTLLPHLPATLAAARRSTAAPVRAGPAPLGSQQGHRPGGYRPKRVPGARPHRYPLCGRSQGTRPPPAMPVS